jgi:hypothetical protein
MPKGQGDQPLPDVLRVIDAVSSGIPRSARRRAGAPTDAR